MKSLSYSISKTHIIPGNTSWFTVLVKKLHRKLWLSNFYTGKCCCVYFGVIPSILSNMMKIFVVIRAIALTQPLHWSFFLINVTRIKHEVLLCHSENLLDLQRISLEAFDRIFIGKYHNFLIQNEIIFELDWNTTWLKGVHLRLYSLVRSLGPHKWGRFLFKALWLQTHMLLSMYFVNMPVWKWWLKAEEGCVLKTCQICCRWRSMDI